MDATLRYSAGNENAPGDPFGATELVIEPSGRARLDHRHVGLHRAWTGQVDAGALERLHALLDDAGFPDMERFPLPAGATLRTLVAEQEGQRRGVRVEWNRARDLPVWRDAFAILDSLVRQLSDDTFHAAPDTLGPAITDLRAVDGVNVE